MSVVTNLLSADDAGLEGGIGSWFAGSNTTVARVTTPAPRTGTASLRLTSTAAGTISAVTTRYAISPNTEYEAYCWAANVAAAAGRVVEISVDWWTSGDVYISSSVTTTTLTLPNSTAWSGPVVLVATSPGTAAKASVVIKVTAGITAGSQQVLFDDFALGVPIQDTGNLLPYNVSSVEMSTAGWGVSNGTLARSTGSAEGVYCLQATSTASGDMTVTAAARVAVTEGTAYEFYPWVFVASVGRSLILELRWYTASVGGTLLSTSSRTVSTIQTAAWERHTLLGTAPATATHVEIRMRPQTTGAAEVWFFDRMTLRVQPLVAGNLLSYAAQSIELDASDWTAAGNCTIAKSAPGEKWIEGAYSLKCTVTAAGEARIEAVAMVPVTAGTYYNADVSFWPVGATPSACWLDIDWYDASMAYLGSATPDQDSDDDGDHWRFDLIGRQAPEGAAWARMVLLPQAGTAAHVFYLDEMSLAAGTPPYVVEAEPETGSVTVTLNNLGGVSTLDLYRVDPDGRLQPVRGYASDVVGYTVTGSTMIFEDYEAPLGVPLRYQYTKYPSESTTRTYSVTVDPPANTGYVWLTDPGQPGRNRLVMVEKPPSWERAVARGVYPIRGAEMPVVLSDVRQSRTGAIQLLTWTEDDENALDFLLATGATLLIRARRGWGLDHLYVSVGDVSEPRPVDSGWEQVRRWVLPLTVVARPIGGIAGSADRTWQDILDDVDTPTWGDVLEKYDTWLDVLQGVD